MNRLSVLASADSSSVAEPIGNGSVDLSDEFGLFIYAGHRAKCSTRSSQEAMPNPSTITRGTHDEGPCNAVERENGRIQVAQW
jgi:hypothetical protein